MSAGILPAEKASWAFIEGRGVATACGTTPGRGTAAQRVRVRQAKRTGSAREASMAAAWEQAHNKAGSSGECYLLCIYRPFCNATFIVQPPLPAK
jgi:hypothetical protein